VKNVPYCEGAKCCDSILHHRASLEGKVRNLTLYIILVKKFGVPFLINTESFLFLIGSFSL